MTPSIVRFTGSDFDPTLLNRRVYFPTPANWVRHQFTVESCYNDPNWALSEWLKNNIFGRWTLNPVITMDGLVVVIGFEQETDAVMFRLSDGETAWRENNVDVF